MIILRETKLEYAGSFPIVYHGTSSKLLLSIKKIGLLPQSMVLKKKLTKYMGSSENPDYVSVTTDRDIAWQFASLTTHNLGGEPIVLIITNLYPLFIDPEGGGSKKYLLFEGSIDPDKIQKYYDSTGTRNRL
jgi:hypothetical protein